ncbi:MAG: aldo/keto reductase [Oscillatoriales cyanobacterium C42_A2020_001]|nr:aldo/keto reductase [Leptolyngbyaceae cyanobacterium C42_A2020_001]
MRYKLLGNSGLRVSELCLGTMTFGEDWGWGGSYDESRKMFDAFGEAGGNFIDTANLYTNGTSEKFVGEFVASDRDRWVVATKYSLTMGGADVNLSGNHRKNMVQAVNASLKRLNLDYIDLLWLHIWDTLTPVEEVMRAFDDLVRSGKVLYIGVSDAPAWIIAQANTIATLRGWTPFVALQIEYSLKERTVERELVPMANALGLGITDWSPLAGGLLTGKYNQPQAAGDARRNDVTGGGVSDRDLAIAQEVVNVANAIGKLPSQVALTWLRQKGGIIPIIGSRKLSQLQENIASLEFELSPEHMQQLDDISAISLGFPHDFINSDQVQNFAFGGSLRTIDR